MSKVLVTSFPTTGHFAPLVAIAENLVGRGHEVLFYTGARFEEAVRRAGARFVPYPEEVDYDEHEVARRYPDYEELTSADRLSFLVQHVFINPAPVHDKRLQELLAEFPASVVIGEIGTAATLAMTLRAPRGERPLTVQICTTPPTFESRDTAPYGLGMLPPVNDEERARYDEMRPQVRQAFAGMQKEAEEVFAGMGVELPDFLFNAWCTIPDHLLQLTVADFEYPRSDGPEGFQFIGPLPPGSPVDAELPAWWSSLPEERPVVVVTQGTVANDDFSQLVTPTLQALADLDVTVVAATARPDGPAVVKATLNHEVPDNAYIAGFLPFEELLPKSAVLVTNAGYGGVQTALRHGVPLVVGGETEDKPEVAARVEWSGTGVNLRSGSPEPAAIRAAVLEVLNDPRYRRRAEDIGERIRGQRPFEVIAEIVENA
ncbi:glycosyltransferase [Streptomyces sp. NPDC086010]|uniref:glycosyltransferase n=1 Tax=Streptomyces sp. NPDC086010 TaxID=3365745 RepID=UPI0037CE3CF9